MVSIVDSDKSAGEKAIASVAKGSLIILLGMILAKVCGFFRQFVIIRMLSAEDYGLFVLSLTIVTVVATVALLGMYQGVQRFIAFYMEKDDLPEVKGTIRSSIMMTTTSSVISMIVIMAMAGTLASFFHKPELKNLLMIMAPIIPFQVLAMMIGAYFLGLHRPMPQVIIESIGFSLMSVIAILVSLLISETLLSPAIAICVTFFLVFLGSIVVYKTRFNLDLSTIKAASVSKALLSFSLPLFLFAALYVVMGNTDTVVIGYYMTSAQVGYYNSAFLLMTVIPIFLSAVAIIYLPVATSLKAREAHAESLSLFQSSTRWPFILTLPIFLTFFLFPAQTLTFLFGSKYSQAATALWILSLGAFLNTFVGPNNIALVAYGETRMVLYGSLSAAVVDVVLNLVLVPRIGITGAAIATASALVLTNLTYSGYLWVKYQLHPFEKKYLMVVTFLFALGIALYWPLRMGINKANWLVIMVYPIFLIASVIFIVITRSVTDEDRLIWRLVKNKIRGGKEDSNLEAGQ